MTSGRSLPRYGRRLLPNIIDDHANQEPEREAFQIPRSSDPKDGWRVVTWEACANAINHAAHRIIEKCGQPEEGSFPTIAYIGPNDARYLVIMVAANKAGYKALFVSPRNSKEGQINLFDKTDCHHVVFPKSHSQFVHTWLAERPKINAIEADEFGKWFPETKVAHFPYNKTFEEAEWDPLVVLHTSGSTGFPKPIVARVGMLSTGDAFQELPEWQGTEYAFGKWYRESKRTYLPMPLFHAAGLYIFIHHIYYNSSVALAVDRPLSADTVAECLDNVDADATLLPPSILEDMSQSEPCIKALQKLKHVVFAGGNLARDSGNRLVQNNVKILNGISATEGCPWPYYYQKNPELWQYFIINSELFGVEWRETGDKDVYEQVIVRKDKNPGLQGFFYTFPDQNEYYTKDLYKAHPSLPNHWIHCGRADDVIVFSNGEKLNPVTIEEIVEDHAQLKGALVFGTNKFQPGIFLEPVSHPKSKEEEQQLIDSVWPLVVQANKETVAHGQIAREFITLTNPEKPFPRAGKGTIQRAGAIKLYQEEIDRLYETAGQVTASEAPRLDVSSEDALVKSIEEMFETHIGSPHLEPDTDFFSAGIDSMQVIHASRLLRAGFKAAGYNASSTALAPRVVYSNSTPRKLAQHLLKTLVRGISNGFVDEASQQQKAMAQLYQSYTRDLPTSKEGRPNAANEGQIVVLTGSTGMLGSYLLDLLVSSPRVEKIICLNRAEDGGVKQQVKAMADRGLTPRYTEKAEFHHIDISRSDFGLPTDVYQRLLKGTDRWIHNAWPVNFNITVETFEPHLRGVRNIGDFAARAEKRVAVVFISSIGTADGWDSKKGPVPEQRLEDMTLPLGGYGRSKMVGSMILEDASKAGDFPAASIRMGQIAGPESEKGSWNRWEYLPSLIASSLYLKALPDDIGADVDWTPVERVAKLIGEVAGVTQQVDPKDVSGYYHGVNPSRTTWQVLAPAVQEAYGKDRLPELVSFKEWVNRLMKTQSEDVKSMDTNPGIKLIDTYRGMAEAAEAGLQQPRFDMHRTIGISPTMRAAQAVGPELMKHWCKQWGF